MSTGMLRVRLDEKMALYNAYMPFVKNGGIFVATAREPAPGQGAGHRLGDEIFLMLQLLDDPNRVAVAGRVIWITPPRSQGGLQSGIGVQFSTADKGQARRRIEELLGSLLQKGPRTSTL